MNRRSLIAPATVVMLLAVSGCYEQIRETRGGWERAAPGWIVKKPGERSAEPVWDNPTMPKAAAKPTTFKADKEIVNPILEAKGNWTVRVWFFYGNPRTRRSALSYANDMAKTLKAKGYHPYVTDLLTKAIVSVGSWDDPNDPDLKRVWREMYDGWLETHRGRKSDFRKTMEGFYGKKTVFGDQPTPISIIDLQMQMKSAYRIEPTADDKRRLKEYLERKATTR